MKEKQIMYNYVLSCSKKISFVNINSKIKGNNSRKSHARVMNLSHTMCVMIRNIYMYLKFEVDT
jgi:hypothetical protein